MQQGQAVAIACLAVAIAYVLVWRRRRRPRVAIIFSGKRKSGKDYCSDALLALCSAAEIGRLSAPLKRAYANEHGLDYSLLLSASEYKEKYRKDMIRWGEERRSADPGYFANLVLAATRAPILIVSDARRPTDVAFFKAHVPVTLVVRVVACVLGSRSSLRASGPTKRARLAGGRSRLASTTPSRSAASIPMAAGISSSTTSPIARCDSLDGPSHLVLVQEQTAALLASIADRAAHAAAATALL